MADRMKESVFSILGAPRAGLRVLDLFAGTGALALESISRGAADAVLVESNREAAEIARENAEQVGFGSHTRMLTQPVSRVLPNLEKAGDRFDWIFVDPPYESEERERTLTFLGKSRLLGNEAVVIVHAPWRHPPAQRYGCLEVADLRRYGQAEVRFYRTIV